MIACINCDNEFEPFQKRDSPHRYKGYYCEECHDHLRDHNELP